MSAGTNFHLVNPPRTVIFCSNSIGQPYGLVGSVSFPNLYAAAQQATGDTVIQYVGPATGSSVGTFTVDTTTNVLTVSAAYPFVVNARVRFTTTTTLPAPLVAGTDYYVLTTPSATTLTLSATLGGAILDITTSGTGTQTILTAPNPCDSVTDAITNYATTIGLYTQAKTGRPLFVILPNCGSSDVINGGDTAAQIYTKIQTLIGLIHADGGKVLIGDICPGSFYTGAVDTRRIDTNTLTQSDLTLFEYFWPMAATHSVDTSTLFGADNQHWSPLGHSVATGELLLAQNDYYRNGTATPLRNNNIILTPISNSDKQVAVIQSAAGASAIQAGIYDPSLPEFGTLWFGPITADTSNYSIQGNGTASLVLNAPTQILHRIGNSTVFTNTATAATVAAGVVFFPAQATTVGKPSYVKGGMYFDTTLNKMRIGGATDWETVTST